MRYLTTTLFGHEYRWVQVKGQWRLVRLKPFQIKVAAAWADPDHDVWTDLTDYVESAHWGQG